MLAQLQDWAEDDAVTAVSIEGAGDRGLCAGGDVRAIREAVLTGTGDPIRFWADEYALNAAIHDYPKPYVAFMDGVVMGGGVGISAYGSLRLVTERSRVAMPETAIGFFPDVGALYLLARAPGELGTHLALTGATVGGADAVALGLADALVDSADLPAIRAALADGAGAECVDALRRDGEPQLAGTPGVDRRVLRRRRPRPGPQGAAGARLPRGRRAAATLLAQRSPLSVRGHPRGAPPGGRMGDAGAGARAGPGPRRLPDGQPRLPRGRARRARRPRPPPRWAHASLEDGQPRRGRGRLPRHRPALSTASRRLRGAGRAPLR